MIDILLVALCNHAKRASRMLRNIHFQFLGKVRIVRICIGVNKMDCDTAGYKQARYDEIANEMKSMLVKVGRPSKLPATKANPSRTFGLRVCELFFVHALQTYEGTSERTLRLFNTRTQYGLAKADARILLKAASMCLRSPEG